MEVISGVQQNEDLQKNIKKRANVLDELVNTEKSYLQKLIFVIQVRNTLTVYKYTFRIVGGQNKVNV